MMANHTSPKQNGTLVIKTKLTISQVVGKYVHHIVYNIGECLIPGDNEAYKEQVRRAGEFYHDIIQALHDEGFIVREGFLAYSKTIEVVETDVPREWVMKQSPMTAKQ